MTEDPRYSPPQPSGRRPNQQGTPGYNQPGFQPPYDWRYPTGPGYHGPLPDPYQPVGAGGGATMPPPVRKKRFRPVALTLGALVIAAFSAGVGGMVAMTTRPADAPVTTIATAAPN